MLFIADQHHMGDLEKKIIKPNFEKGFEGKKRKLCLMGDISPTDVTVRSKTVLKKIQDEYKKSVGMNICSELSYNEKLDAHKQGIEMAFENDWLTALELTVFYGAASLINIARKNFINSFSSEKTLCLMGNEPIMEHAQDVIYSILMKKEKIKKSELFDYIIHTIKNNIKGFSKKGLNRKEKKRLSNLKKVYPLIQEQLAAAGIPKTKTADFLKKQISDFKKMPSAYDIFKTKSDKLYNFKFVEDIQVEREGRCIIVYVPFLSTEEQKASAINYTRGKFNNDLKKGRRLYPVIAYHGNPFSKGMDDKKAQLRIDHNKQVIESVIEGLSKSKSIPKNRQIQILCSHLHKSNSPYDWTTDFSKTVSLIPLGVTDYIVLDTKKGNFSKAVTYKKIPWL